MDLGKQSAAIPAEDSNTSQHRRCKSYDEELASFDSTLGVSKVIETSSKGGKQGLRARLEHEETVGQPPTSSDVQEMMPPLQLDAQRALLQDYQHATVDHHHLQQEQALPQGTSRQSTPPRSRGRKSPLMRRHSARALTDQEKKEFDIEDASSRSPVHKHRSLGRFIDEVRSQSRGTDSDLPRTPTRKNHKQSIRGAHLESAPLSPHATKLTLEDIEVCRQLDDEYERALEEREIGYTARYNSVRQSAFLSVFFMLSYLVLGTAFFMRQTDWSVADSLLFSIYTVTTVGYGNQPIPRTSGFQIYTIFYILVGIAALTIMVAQVYQCIALEASRAQYSRDKTEMARRGLETLTTKMRRNNDAQGNLHGQASADEIISYHQENMPGILDHMFRCFDRAKTFFRSNEIGRGISVLFPFTGLILVGALVVGPIEEWTLLESIYFSVVSLTTVGFGDYFPTKQASIWFCVFWLPFSVGFMSLYLGNVASFYIRLSDKNIVRIERHMRRQLERAKRKAQLEREEAFKRAYRGQDVDWENPGGIVARVRKDSADSASLDEDKKLPPRTNSARKHRRKEGPTRFEELPTTDNSSDDIDDTSVVSVNSSGSGALFGQSRQSDTGGLRRNRILSNSIAANLPKVGDDKGEHDGKVVTRQPERTMQSMRDVIRAVRRNLSASQTTGSAYKLGSTEFELMSIRSNKPLASHSIFRRDTLRKPSFALRVLVQERVAEIIATDIAGYQSSIDIKENTLSVTIDTLRDTADKWLIPRRSRKAFRAVAFETLYFVGEHGLITRGADALFDLTPFEVHGLFSPLLASMGDAETMESWLANTDILAEVDLRRDGARQALSYSSDSTGNRSSKSQAQKLATAATNKSVGN